MKNTQPLKYQMTQKMFEAMLSKRNKSEEKQNPYDYIMKVINNEFGLRGTVTELSII